MKTIAVILPINNPDILSQADLDSYQTDNHYFQVHYVDTSLREIKTMDEAAIVLPLTIQKIQETERQGASLAIVFAFGDLGIAEAKHLVSIPIMGLGKPAIHLASVLCRHRFTVIPGMLVHTGFIADMIREDHLEDKYIETSSSPEITPAEIRKDPLLLEKLIAAADLEIQEKGVDTFTLGCGSFIGIGKRLERALQTKYQGPIIVVDPVKMAFDIAKSLI
jgi:allantoin racemase